jgi:hypothetical protein
MTTVNLKPLAARLMERLQNIFAGHRSRQCASRRIAHPPSIPQESQEIMIDAEVAFLASIAHLPVAERTERIQRREWYADMAARQAIADVEWSQQRYQQTGNRLYRP